MSDTKDIISFKTPGLGFLEVLTLIFIVLKLLGKITWGWWWVLSPIWIPFALFIVGGVIYLVVSCIPIVIDVLRKWNKLRKQNKNE